MLWTGWKVLCASPHWGGGAEEGLAQAAGAAGDHRTDGAKDTPWLLGLVGIGTPGLAPTFPTMPRP